MSAQKKLRTLNLSNFWFRKLPEPIGNLEHLRYLDVSFSSIQKLPESISSLQNLQTLNLSNCSRLYMLPKRMKDMKSLMYLDLTGCDALQCMPSGMGQLACLRKLGMFIVGREAGHHIGELQRLNYIGGELSIKDLGNVQGFTDAQNANLMRKTNLQSLSLSWREDDSSKIGEANSEDVLCALEPHSNMKKLQISGYRGSKFPDWMMELRLPNLVEISLESCMNCEHVPPFGKLRFLKHLQLKRMDTVKCIGGEMYGDGENPFPSLERLTLGPMMNLEEWETDSMGGREIFTCLDQLQIKKCPKLVELPIIPSVKYLTIEDCAVTLLRSVVNFTSITSLRIEGFDELAVLPDGLLQNHTCLQKLSITKMRSLRSLSNLLINLSSLKHLAILYCDKLESLPDGVQNLNSLEMLIIYGMPKITALSVLPSSLATLRILNCEELTSLSEGLQYLTALKDLELYRCDDYFPSDISGALLFKVSSQKKLRTLNLSCFTFEKLPEPIGNLQHLRYLDVSNSLIQKLPESISSLQNLQTLNLSNCSRLYMLPKRMKDMKSLMYLDLTGCDALQCMPSGMGQLTCLRKLGMFIVGKEAGHHIGELQRLNYIGGELSIKDLGNVQGLTDAQNANLRRKTNLQSLSLSWREDNSSKISEAKSEDVLCALEPHSNMKKLEISGYRGSKFPDWMMELRLPNLVEISLESCMNCEHLPPFGKLRFLKHLQLKRMDTVKCIGSEMYGDGENPFPSLKRLTLGQMMNLEEWETNSMGGREIFTCLDQLQIRKCLKLVELPIIPSVKYLTIEDCAVTLLRSVVNFTSITSLQIEGFDELTVLPDGLLQNHTCLRSLIFRGMRSLRSLSNQLSNLSSLVRLDFLFCDDLESLPEGVQNLNSLEALLILGMPKITTLSGLPSSLGCLYILGCEELTSLSEGLQYLTVLKEFCLAGCVKLNSMPETIRHLTSLQTLRI
ncbi:hypothetical protein NC652_038522 [Populus alba x Populus x berolinensis]|nr:hypothetical protein NC652_038522 [Populus alba x Populus x berolinensis]